jgi:hypothetical protein
MTGGKDMKVLREVLLAVCIVAFTFGSSQAASLIDRSGQVLGEFIYEECIYVHSLGKIVCINDYSSDPTQLGNIDQTDIFFATADCTGAAYTTEQWQTQYIYRNGTRYYTGKAAFPPTAQSLLSALHEGVCQAGSETCNPCWQLKQVTPKFPFDLPVALPLRVIPGD